MALLKEKQTEYGVTANYWKVEMVSIDRHMKEANFSLNLYVNKDAKQFIETYTVSDLMGQQDKSKYESYFESDTYKDIYAACYAYAKDNIDYFKDAVSDS